MSSVYVLEILRGLRNLVGSDAFDACVQSVQSGAEVPPSVGGAKKERKPHVVDPEKSAKRSADMTALQTFIKKAREEAGEGAVYKEVQKSAGARWKAMTEEEKTAWKATNLDTNKTVTVSTETAETKPAKVNVKAVKDSESVEKKAGRPKKA
jgi:hypothetical protein